MAKVQQNRRRLKPKGGTSNVRTFNFSATSETSWEPSNSQFQYIEVQFPFQRMIKKIFIAGAKDKNAWVTKFMVWYQVAQGQRWHDVVDADSNIKVEY